MQMFALFYLEIHSLDVMFDCILCVCLSSNRLWLKYVISKCGESSYRNEKTYYLDIFCKNVHSIRVGAVTSDTLWWE